MNLIVQERKATRQNLFQFDNSQFLTSSLHIFSFLHLFFSFFLPSFLFFPLNQNNIPLILSFLHFEVLFLKSGQQRVLYYRIRKKEGFEVLIVGSMKKLGNLAKFWN